MGLHDWWLLEFLQFLFLHLSSAEFKEISYVYMHVYTNRQLGIQANLLDSM